MGFEPMHIGTTIRGLNRLTTGAIFPTPFSIPYQTFNARAGQSFNFDPLFINKSLNLFSGTYNRFRELLILTQGL